MINQFRKQFQAIIIFIIIMVIFCSCSMNNDEKNNNSTIDIDIPVDMDEPVGVVLEGYSEILFVNDFFEVTATTSEEINYYLWYLNNQILWTGSFDSIIINSSDIEPGNYSLACIVVNGERIGSATVSFTYIGREKYPAVDDVANLRGKPRNEKVILYWNDPVDDNLMEIEISFLSEIMIVDKGVNTLVITGLTNDTEYTFTVKTVNIDGVRSEGKSVTIVPRLFDYEILLNFRQQRVTALWYEYSGGRLVDIHETWSPVINYSYIIYANEGDTFQVPNYPATIQFTKINDNSVGVIWQPHSLSTTCPLTGSSITSNTFYSNSQVLESGTMIYYYPMNTVREYIIVRAYDGTQ